MMIYWVSSKYIQDKWIKFGIEKYAMLIMKKGDKQQKELNYPIRDASEHLKKKKTINIWKY